MPHGTRGHTEQFTTEARCVVKDTLLHLPEMIGEAGERGDLHTDQRKRETWDCLNSESCMGTEDS